MRMQNVLYRLSDTPGSHPVDRAARTGRTPAPCSAERLGLDDAELDALVASGVIAQEENS